MVRISIVAMALFWGCLTATLAITLSITAIVPSKGTILVSRNVFLDSNERFELYDINQGIHYRFTPDVNEGTLAVSLAPKGRKMAVISVWNRQFSLSITDYVGNTVIDPIIRNYALNFDEIRWSSDGRYFMFYDAFASESGNIFILDTQSNNLREISSHEGLHPSASWSPDEQNIAYTNITNGEEISQIWIADVNGQNPRQLTFNGSTSYCPTWSPDGKTLAYIEQVGNGDQLRFINTDGTDNSNYFSDIWQMTTCPSWSGNQNYISFVSLNLNSYKTQVILLDVITGEELSLFEIDQSVSLQLWR